MALAEEAVVQCYQVTFLNETCKIHPIKTGHATGIEAFFLFKHSNLAK